MEFIFNANGDYKTEFKSYVDLLFDKIATISKAQRLKLVEGLTESYFHITGEAPNGGQLDRLASFILHDDLEGNRKSNKKKTVEYSILSDRQMDTRERGEADERLAQNYGTDGKKHGRGTRNHKTNALD